MIDSKRSIDTFWLVSLISVHVFAGFLWHSEVVVIPFFALLKSSLIISAAYLTLHFFIEKAELGPKNKNFLIHMSLGLMLLQITVTIHYLGGSEGFIFYPLFFFPIVAAGILFSGFHAFAIAFLSALCITLLSLFEDPSLSQYLAGLGLSPAALDAIQRMPFRRYRVFGLVLSGEVSAALLLSYCFVFFAFATMTQFLNRFYRMSRSMEKDIKGMENLFNLSLFTAPTGFVIGYRHDYGALYFNKMIMDAFGLKEGERGKNIFSLLSFEAEVVTFLKGKIDRGDTVDLKVASVVLADGSKTFFQLRLSFLNYPTLAGEEGLFLLVMNNVTEELQLANIITNFREAVILLDEAGRVHLFNRAAMLVVPEVKKGMNLEDVLDATRSFRQETVTEILRDEVFEGKVQIGLKTYLFSSSPLRDVTGVKLGILLTLKDVTNEELFYNMSIRDEMTGFYNRRYFMDFVEREVDQSERYEKIFSLVLLDIDFFKKVNDTYGHQAGDFVLKAFAESITNSIRKSDVAARIGGEEFAVFMPFVKEEGTVVLCERIRENVEKLDIVYGEQSIRITCSIGVSHYRKGVRLKEIFMEADSALYEAKRTGRNRVRLYSA